MLQAVLASALLPHTAAAWPAAFLASPINWPNLLKAPARARAALYAGFQVKPSPRNLILFWALASAGLWQQVSLCKSRSLLIWHQVSMFALQDAMQADAETPELSGKTVLHLHPHMQTEEHTQSLLTALVENVLGSRPPLDQPLMEVCPNDS